MTIVHNNLMPLIPYCKSQDSSAMTLRGATTHGSVDDQGRPLPSTALPSTNAINLQPIDTNLRFLVRSMTHTRKTFMEILQHGPLHTRVMPLTAMVLFVVKLV